MAPLGPFEPRPALAVAVSGGGDSMALALLARDWAAARDGSVLALVVDHGLRPESAAEAALTCARLAAVGIAARLLALSGLGRGPALAARARAARYEALADACAEAGILHLLLGHHALDQAETAVMRLLAGSHAAGLAAMAALVETGRVRLLRPLLACPPVRLRATLRAACVAWVDDPSNADPAAQRARVRARRGDVAGTAPATQTLVAAAAARGAARAAAERAVAAELAGRVAIHPEGYALWHGGTLSAEALAALIRTLSGRQHPPALAAAAALVAAPRAATLGGVRLLPAGRLAPRGGWLLVREAAAMAPAVPARPGAVWDGRFRLERGTALPAGTMLGPLGAAAAALRHTSPLPAALMRTLPALWRDGLLVAVPHLRYPDAEACAMACLAFSPATPLAPAPFVPSRSCRCGNRVGDATAR